MTSTPNTEAARGTSNLNGIIMMLVGVALLSINDAFAKNLADSYSPLQILFIRNIIALPFAFVVVRAVGGRAALRSHSPWIHLIRGVFWVASTFLFFTSIKHLGLAKATALVFVSPLMIILLAALFLGERVGLVRWLAVIFGFIGTLIIIRPGAASFEPVLLVPIAAAFTTALLLLSARWLDERDNVWTLLLYLTGASALISACLVPLVWEPVEMRHWPAFLAIAFFGTTAITLITQSYRIASAVAVTPFNYTGLIWAILLGWYFWNDVPDWATYLGSVIIIIAAIVTVFQEAGDDAEG